MILLLKCTDKAQLFPKRLPKILLAITAIVLMVSCATSPPKSKVQDEGYVVQAVQYMNAGRLDAAFVSVKKALELNPESADAYTVAGLIYNKNNQTEQAERYFKRALSFDPNHSAAQTNYASFLCKHDKPLEAEKIYIAAAKNKNNKQPDVAYTNAGLCVLGIPDKVKATNYFSTALKINPKSPVPWYQLAKIQYGNYSYENAYKLLKEYEKVAQPTPKTLLLGAQINDANGKPDLANQYKLLLVQQFPNSKEAKQFSSKSTLQQQPATYDARELLNNDQAY
ncbi:MAG: type IV pilus biogenesis/stability protein PilW [Gammaproteobacteria bacterium]|nr:type IV pilus biogenesis/stability protein PilW [Gammaproteobacteria bacterium]